MKKPFVIHPFLFAIYPILFLFSHNIRQTSFSQILLPLAIALGFTLLLLLLAKLILRDNIKAGIVVSIFLVLCFSYGHVYSMINVWQIGGFVIGRHRYLLPAWGALFSYSAYFIIRTRRNLHNFTSILNVMSLSLVVISLINIGTYKLKTRVAWRDIKSTERIEINTMDSRRVDTLPDIYYIILDRYASASTLKEFYGFDNSEFIDYLSNKGFYVASESRANYPGTAYSLASSLNMEYINYLSEKLGENYDNLLPLFEMSQDYKVWRFLKKKGYKFIHFGSFCRPTDLNKYADTNINVYFINEISTVLYGTTVFYPIGSKLGIFDTRWMQRKRILYQFDKLAEMPDIKEPTFVFAHMIIPHGPYVFDRNGNFLTEGEVNKRSRRKNYLEQLIFVNKKVKMLIDKLLSSSKPLPIIILQSDEGPWPERYRLDDKSFDWKQATNAEFREKFRILNAYYLPDVNKDVLYPSITPVNSFRLIFNLYFNTDFELLPDESYASEDYTHPYKFFNVTDKVNCD